MYRREIFLPIVFLLAFCTPKSPDLSPKERNLVNLQDWLTYAETVRVETARQITQAYVEDEISEETYRDLRSAVAALEGAQRAAVSASRIYVMGAPLGEMRLAEEGQVVEIIKELRHAVTHLIDAWEEVR